MGEAATAAPAQAAPQAAPPPQAPSASAGAQLAAVPDWAASFNDAVKPTVSRFKSAEDLAVAYQNLEKMKGVPEDRLLKLPEKWDGPEARAVWEKLGAPKDAKGYELSVPEKGGDPKLAEWAASTFHQNNLTKAQAHGVMKAWNDQQQAMINQQMEAHANAIKQADATLQKEWGAQYETNVNLAKQGAKILGLDAKTLDQLEALQGRESLFKTLSKLGASVGESNFVTGSGGTPTAISSEEAQQQINSLKGDMKFGKALRKGDSEAIKKWNDLHKIAFPGEKPIG